MPTARGPATVARRPKGDLSITALYTSATWSWAGLPNAGLLEHDQARGVFKLVNLALFLAHPFAARRAPLRIALLHRHAMIDAIVEASGCRRVLELAAGLSRRGLTFSADEGLQYTEVDAPHVLDTKRRLLGRTAEGQRALARGNWRFLEADVTRVPIDSLAPPDGAPLVVIAEGLFMYLPAEAQQALFRALAARLARGGGTLVFDLVPTSEQPAPGIAGRMLEWVMKRFTGGQSFVRDPRTRTHIADELRSAGFQEVSAIEPSQVAQGWHLPYPEVRTQQLLFVARMAPLLDLPHSREPHA